MVFAAQHLIGAKQRPCRVRWEGAANDIRCSWGVRPSARLRRGRGGRLCCGRRPASRLRPSWQVLTRHAVAVPVEVVGVARVFLQHSLRLFLCCEDAALQVGVSAAPRASGVAVGLGFGF
jgi:hypothetical protein